VFNEHAVFLFQLLNRLYFVVLLKLTESKLFNEDSIQNVSFQGFLGLRGNAFGYFFFITRSSRSACNCVLNLPTQIL